MTLHAAGTGTLDRPERIRHFGVVRACLILSEALPMSRELNSARTPGSIGRGCGFLLGLLLSLTAPLAGASDVGANATTGQQSTETHPREQDPQAKQNPGSGPNAPAAAPGFCEALAAAATTNELPIDFFTRLIWQESRFKPDAISPKGAQGIAQFMPTTARSSGLADPFNPLDAIAKSGQLLRDLRREFGNLGLAAAAYNAGSGRVHDWLGDRRPLPLETRAYVQLVTGRSVEQWTDGQTDGAAIASVVDVPCNLPTGTSIAPEPASPPRPESVKPWGVEVVGGPTAAKALVRYHEWQPKYAAIVGDREPHVVIRGFIGQMGAARVRLGEDTRPAATRLCASLHAAGAYCEVMRN